jgi:formyl-CoA transferase/CoA:oxalate CoA-transferase
MTSGAPLLKGIRVVELAQFVAGPMCAMLLGDMGADVIKIEKPGGDDTRAIPPFWNDESTYFLSLNRNKRSVVLDLRDADALAAASRMVREADVVIEGYRGGVAERLGLDYETVASANPMVIYCRISGFGRTGPKRDRRAFDLMMQAECGLMSVTGEPGRPPVRVGFSIVDVVAGLYAAWGVTSALFARERLGRGQFVDTSLLETQIASYLYLLTAYYATGEVPVCTGSAHPNFAPYQAFETRDGYVVIAAGSDGLWRGLCEALGVPRMADDPRFRTNPDRVRHRAELEAMIAGQTRARTTAETVATLAGANIPCAPVNRIDVVLNDPQTAAREMVASVVHPRIPDLKLAGLPVKFSMTPGAIHRPPPLLGEHTGEVLAEFGLAPVARSQ